MTGWSRFPRRLLIFLLIAVLTLFAAHSIFGDRGLLAQHRRNRELARLRAEVDAAQMRNSAMLAEIKRLRQARSLSLESLARERLGYIKPGEVTFLFPEGSSDPPPMLEPDATIH